MKISEEQRETIERKLIATYEGNNFTYSWDNLCAMIVKEFLDNIEEYEENNYLEDICNDITGNYNGSYTCSTYESAKLIAENIFEFNAIVDSMEEIGFEPFKVTETETNLVRVLLFICDITILNQDCETLGELIEKLS